MNLLARICLDVCVIYVNQSPKLGPAAPSEPPHRLRLRAPILPSEPLGSVHRTQDLQHLGGERCLHWGPRMPKRASRHCQLYQQ